MKRNPCRSMDVTFRGTNEVRQVAKPTANEFSEVFGAPAMISTVLSADGVDQLQKCITVHRLSEKARSATFKIKGL